MSFFEDIFDKFLLKDNQSFVGVSNNIPKFDGINLNSLVVYAPKNIFELNKVIDCIVANQSIIINFSSIKKNDYDAMSNYLSGAVFALKAQVFKLQSCLYVIVPKHIKIATL